MKYLPQAIWANVEISQVSVHVNSNEFSDSPAGGMESFEKFNMYFKLPDFVMRCV